MRSLTSSLWQWWRSRKMSIAQKLAWRWKCESLSLLRDLRKESRKLEKLRDQISEDLNTCEAYLRDAQRLFDEQDHIDEALNQELQILKDVVLPDIALARQVVRSQQEADIAMYARHRAIAQPDGKE